MTGTHAPHDCGTCCEARGCEPDVFAVTHGPLILKPDEFAAVRTVAAMLGFPVAASEEPGQCLTTAP